MYYDLMETFMAYRNFPLRVEDDHLFGFCWNKLYYFDKYLPMACSASCPIFDRFSSVLHWIGQYYMPQGLMFHILDACLIVAPTADKCQVYLDKLLEICNEIGIPLAAEKIMRPLTCLACLGIELDTVT